MIKTEETLTDEERKEIHAGSNKYVGFCEFCGQMHVKTKEKNRGENNKKFLYLVSEDFFEVNDDNRRVVLDILYKHYRKICDEISFFKGGGYYVNKTYPQGDTILMGLRGYISARINEIIEFHDQK